GVKVHALHPAERPVWMVSNVAPEALMLFSNCVMSAPEHADDGAAGPLYPLPIWSCIALSSVPSSAFMFFTHSDAVWSPPAPSDGFVACFASPPPSGAAPDGSLDFSLQPAPAATTLIIAVTLASAKSFFIMCRLLPLRLTPRSKIPGTLIRAT